MKGTKGDNLKYSTDCSNNAELTLLIGALYLGIC